MDSLLRMSRKASLFFTESNTIESKLNAIIDDFIIWIIWLVSNSFTHLLKLDGVFNGKMELGYCYHLDTVIIQLM